MTVLKFKDHFSGHASAYADARPHYPHELFAWLATLTHNHDTAWDCGTGNGQAALGLASYYRQVIATDPSKQQIESAFPHVRVSYRVAPAESPDLEPHCVDLVTVAQAVHWFDRPKFYTQVKKVLRPGGVLAVWCYSLCSIEPAIDTCVNAFYCGETDAYWPPERALIDDGYRSIEFPFEEISPPAFRMQQRWTLEQFLAYLRTWSAVQKFISKNGRDPVTALNTPLEKLWGGSGAVKIVSWPLHIRAGRV
ncbi:MAG: class I SAM-dependent methyltransferase [Gammaproteobacteria bacterium]